MYVATRLAFAVSLVALLTRAAWAVNGVPTPDHVVIVMEENRSDAQVYGNATFPYFNSLANNLTSVPAAKFTSYGGITHPSEPNYIAFFSGHTFGISDDAVHAFSTFADPGATNLGAKLLNSGNTFVGYSEGLTAVGSQASSSGKYARKHNPWANWQDASIPVANRIPTAANRPFAGAGNWPSTDFSQLPALSIVVPNLNNDGHDTSDNSADNWLINNIKPYAEWSVTHNSLLIVTWDEDEGSGKIATAFAGAMVKPGVYNAPTNHYGLLRTLEDMYGFSHDTVSTQGAATITAVWVPEPSSLSLLLVGTGCLAKRRARCARA